MGEKINGVRSVRNESKGKEKHEDIRRGDGGRKRGGEGRGK